MPAWYGGSSLNPDGITRAQDQWRNQWERTLRWYGRTVELKNVSLKQELEHNDIDVVIAFFQNCYHLRDWIAESRPELKNALEKFFDDNFEMGACRDVCNGFKHKNLKRPTHDKDFNLYREADHLGLWTEKGDSPIKYRLAFADGAGVKKFDVFELAQTCVGLWHQFLHTNGVII